MLQGGRGVERELHQARQRRTAAHCSAAVGTGGAAATAVEAAAQGLKTLWRPFRTCSRAEQHPCHPPHVHAHIWRCKEFSMPQLHRNHSQVGSTPGRHDGLLQSRLILDTRKHRCLFGRSGQLDPPQAHMELQLHDIARVEVTRQSSGLEARRASRCGTWAPAHPKE